MSKRILLQENEIYHIYNRGVDKRVVFENDADHKRFCLLLYLCNGSTPVKFDHLPNWRGSTSPELIRQIFEYDKGRPLVAIGAYCLMPNHFHLLLKQITRNGISTFMQRLSTAYTMYFNLGRARTGALFQGRFKARHADTDTYLKYLFSYIHLNPAKIIEPRWKELSIAKNNTILKFLNSYPYSSYMDYMNTQREFSKILSRNEFPDYFPSAKKFQSEINDWLSFAEPL